MAESAGIVKAEISKRRKFVGAIWRFCQEKPVGAIGGFLFLVMTIVALTAHWSAPQDPFTVDVAQRLAAPSWAHWFGTDHLGRDVFSRVIYGARISIIIGVGATFFGTTIGAILGVISGYLGGKTDLIFQRVMDVIMAFPALVLIMAIMAVMGNTVLNVILAISIPSIPRANRVSRAVAVSVKEMQFVEAAKATGGTTWHIIAHHIIPNCMASYMIVATTMLSGAILMEASLSFLGLGVPVEVPSWGRSLFQSMAYMRPAPWLSIFPGIAITLIVYSTNMFGDALRDVLDPRLKRL